jgi:ABC-type nickel/cobalt efflux system permease component RcnA
MVLGVLAGSALWWLALTTVVALLRQRLSARAMQWVRRGSGALLMAFGLYQLWGLWELLH